MKQVHLCERSVSRICCHGWYDACRYRYEYVDLIRCNESRRHIKAKCYRLIDIAQREYGNFEIVKIYW